MNEQGFKGERGGEACTYTMEIRLVQSLKKSSLSLKKQTTAMKPIVVGK